MKDKRIKDKEELLKWIRGTTFKVNGLTFVISNIYDNSILALPLHNN